MDEAELAGKVAGVPSCRFPPFDKIGILNTDTPGSDLPLHVAVMNCLNCHDEDTWSSLVSRLQPVFARVIFRVASRAGVAQLDEVDDLVQESFLKIHSLKLASIQDTVLKDEQSAWAYLKTLAVNTARDHFRGKTAEKRGAAKTSSLTDRLDELAGSYFPNPDKTVLIAQIDTLLSADPQSRTIFWLYYKQGFTAKEIAAIPKFKLGIKGVESLLRRLAAFIREKLSAPAEGIFNQETL